MAGLFCLKIKTQPLNTSESWEQGREFNFKPANQIWKFSVSKTLRNICEETTEYNFYSCVLYEIFQ